MGSLARKRVAIIGAGSAGLSMASQLPLSQFDPVLFERRSEVGGIWQYDAEPGPCRIRFDRRGRAYPVWQGKGNAPAPPGPMYDGLRTNIPADLMAFHNFPFPADDSLFPSRSSVQSYIERYATHKDLRKLIRFNTAVENVWRPSPTEAWQLVSRSLPSGSTRTELFDYIVVASGRCNTPSIPFIPGLWHFTGQVLHSAWYRFPQPFANRTVLVVGNSSSGCDMARELVGHVTREFPGSQEWRDSAPSVTVYQSYENVEKPPPMDYDPRDAESPAWAKRIRVVPSIERILPSEKEGSAGRILFTDGSTLDDVDTILFGTGFVFDFPFLDHTRPPFSSVPLIDPPSAKPADDGYTSSEEPYDPPRTAPKVSNLDDWYLFYRGDTSLVLLGVPTRIVPFPVTTVQSRAVAAIWAGQMPAGLPALDPSIPPTEPDRWTSRPSDTSAPVEPFVADLKYPSDVAYVNAILSLLPQELKSPGSDDELEAPEDLSISQPTDEGWQKVPRFRAQRRENAKTLRRHMLGY